MAYVASGTIVNPFMQNTKPKWFNVFWPKEKICPLLCFFDILWSYSYKIKQVYSPNKELFKIWQLCHNKVQQCWTRNKGQRRTREFQAREAFVKKLAKSFIISSRLLCKHPTDESERIRGMPWRHFVVFCRFKKIYGQWQSQFHGASAVIRHATSDALWWNLAWAFSLNCP